jgi:hypothetical protein
MRRAARATREAQLLRRIALAASPPADRPWVEALFSELDVIEGAQPRLTWLVGAVQLVATRNAVRGARLLADRLHLAIAFAFCAAILSAVISRLGYESLGDDDFYLALASVFTLAGGGLALRAIRPSIRGDDRIKPA